MDCGGQCFGGKSLGLVGIGSSHQGIDDKIKAITMPELLEARYQSKGMKIYAKLNLY